MAISVLVVIADNLLDPSAHLLGNHLTMPDTEAMRDLLVVDPHSRFPAVGWGGDFGSEGGGGRGNFGSPEPAGGDEVVAGLLGNPCVFLAPEEEEVGVDGVFAVGAG